MKLAATVLGAALALLSFSVDAADVPAIQGWVFRNDSRSGTPCRAVKLGTSVDIQLLRNKENKMVVSLGHPDWDLPFGQTNLTLAIDDETPVSFDGSALGRVVLIVVADEVLAQKIRNAKTLKWHSSWGDFTADVDGFGAAYDTIGICSD